MRRPLSIALHWALDYRFALSAVARDLVSEFPPPTPGDKTPVVILPGIFEKIAFTFPLVDQFASTGHPIHRVSGLGYNALPIPESARRLSAYLDENNLRDVILLAHSKGGLIGKYAMTFLDPSSRIDRMIAVSTPFSGSVYGSYVPFVKCLREFSPSSDVIRSLREDTRVNDRIVSIYASFDPHIPGSSELPGAALNLRARGIGHFRIVNDPEVLEAVRAAIP